MKNFYFGEGSIEDNKKENVEVKLTATGLVITEKQPDGVVDKLEYPEIFIG